MGKLIEFPNGNHYNGHVYRILLSEKAEAQYAQLSGKLKQQVDKGLRRIASAPKRGKPLWGPLKGVWSERVSTFRILYRIYEEEVEVLIITIEHRKTVYGGHDGR